MFRCVLFLVVSVVICSDVFLFTVVSAVRYSDVFLFLVVSSARCSDVFLFSLIHWRYVQMFPFSVESDSKCSDVFIFLLFSLQNVKKCFFSCYFRYKMFRCVPLLVSDTRCLYVYIPLHVVSSKTRKQVSTSDSLNNLMG